MGGKDTYETVRTSRFDSNNFKHIDSEGNVFTFFVEKNQVVLEKATIKTSKVIVPSSFEDENGNKYYVSIVGRMAFCKEQKLKHIIFSDGIRELRTGLFADCGSVLSVCIPPSVKKLEAVFWRCQTFEENEGGIIYYSGSKEEWRKLIASDEFRRMMDSTQYNEVVRFAKNTDFLFADTDFRTAYNQDDESEISYLRVCEKGNEVIIPDFYIDDRGMQKTITHIGRSSFAGNKNVTKVIIPSTVQSICDDAFYECENLEEVVIMKSNKELSVGTGAFYNCKNLKKIYTGRECRWGTYALENTNAEIIKID